MGNTPHVAIVGAGFGGLGVAEQLDHVPVEVTLIDQFLMTTSFSLEERRSTISILRGQPSMRFLSTPS